MEADAGDTLILVNTEGASATASVNIVVCGAKVSEVPVMTTLVGPVLAELLAISVKLAVVAEVEANDAVTPLGRPEAARLTLSVKPPVGLIVTVLTTLPP